MFSYLFNNLINSILLAVAISLGKIAVPTLFFLHNAICYENNTIKEWCS